ncbi:MAG: hypothetical protein HKN19_07645 [Halioglobus sp.]|nr:hypothetical protein [Halioglobus sp.]
MSEMEDGSACVLLPVATGETWAVPQNCLAEILTVHTKEEAPPRNVDWRGRQVPVFSLCGADDAPWCDARRGAGLVAIFLGLEGEELEYYGVAVNGDGMRAARITAGVIEDAPDEVAELATAAFRYKDMTCQVPDLDRLQQRVSQEQGTH